MTMIDDIRSDTITIVVRRLLCTVKQNNTVNVKNRLNKNNIVFRAINKMGSP